MRNERWSQSDIDKLCELWRAGASITIIARKLKRTYLACVSKVDRLRDDEGMDLPLRRTAGAVR